MPMVFPEVKKNRTLVCECGNEKSHNARSCNRCEFLDGGRSAEGAFIETLRGTTGLTLREIAASMGHSTTRNSHRIALSLLKAGRLKRYWGEIGAKTVEIRKRGCMFSGKVGNGGAWVYELSTPPEGKCR